VIPSSIKPPLILRRDVKFYHLFSLLTKPLY
jgi:hypothetical protein